ncbi:MAG: 3-carboxy-cis,cis-muconate cycloisomerase [Paracoccaceae bacterium]|nr:3-carboxy-cis,cis-muconate cycloisomerase [Paracoccaceae bacterium]
MISVFDHPWLGPLFGDDDTRAAWSGDRQIAHYLAFEAALARALGAAGLVDGQLAREAAAHVSSFAPGLADLAAGSKRDGVPIPSLVAALRAAFPDHGTAIHTGATSQDVLDTALALTLKDISAIALRRIDGLEAALGALADRFGANALMGRTRMQAAQPITVADRIGTWARSLAAARRRLSALRNGVEVLQLGGPVGTRADWAPHEAEVADAMAHDLGLGSATAAWHTDRGGLIAYAGSLATLGGSLGKIGQDICLMAQQGIDEIALSGGGGSSSMPHKANPVEAELLATLARYSAAQMSAMHGAMVHEQERSGAAWMLEWMVLPGLTVATCRGLAVAEELCGRVTAMGQSGA